MEYTDHLMLREVIGILKNKEKRNAKQCYTSGMGYFEQGRLAKSILEFARAANNYAHLEDDLWTGFSLENGAKNAKSLGFQRTRLHLTENAANAYMRCGEHQKMTYNLAELADANLQIRRTKVARIILTQAQEFYSYFKTDDRHMAKYQEIVTRVEQGLSSPTLELTAQA